MRLNLLHPGNPHNMRTQLVNVYSKHSSFSPMICMIISNSSPATGTRVGECEVAKSAPPEGANEEVQVDGFGGIKRAATWFS
jgi:hypothetical protein